MSKVWYAKQTEKKNVHSRVTHSIIHACNEPKHTERELNKQIIIMNRKKKKR